MPQSLFTISRFKHTGLKYKPFMSRTTLIFTIDIMFGTCGGCRGAVGGALASWLTSPLDLAKLRLQVQRASASQRVAANARYGGAPFEYRNTVHALMRIARHEGVAGLFRGAQARVMFHMPATAITFSLFEQCKKAFAFLLEPDQR